MTPAELKAKHQELLREVLVAGSGDEFDMARANLTAFVDALIECQRLAIKRDNGCLCEDCVADRTAITRLEELTK